MNKLIDTKGLKRAIENIKSFINKNYITKVTYEELVELRNNSKLIPGKQYRIIDYVTTTVQENTRSVGHQFDIIVTADDEKTLNENARACHTKFDIEKYKDAYSNTWGERMIYIGTYKYNGKIYYHYESESKDMQMLVDFRENVEDKEFDAVGDYRYRIYPSYSTNENNDWETELGDDITFKHNPAKDAYFNASNLSAWEIKYSLDNNKQYSWAKNLLSPTSKNNFIQVIDEINNPETTYIYVRYKNLDKNEKFAWVYDANADAVPIENYINDYENLDDSDIIYTNSLYPNINDILENGYIVKDVSWGKGVIYYMKDEYNNEAPYDFKNIQYKYGLYENGSLGDDLQDADFIKYLYTFSWLDNIDDSTESKDCSVIGNDGTISDDENNTKLVYNNTINTTFFRSINNISSLPFVIFLSNSEYDSGIFYGYHGNVIEKDCSNIRFLNQCHYNHISDSYRIDLSNESDNNNILKANRCYIRGFYNFIYGSGDNIEHHIEIIGDNNKIYRSEVIKIRGDYNIVEDGCYDIICGQKNPCSHNIFKSCCHNITFGQNFSCDHNIVYEDCAYIYLGKSNISNINIIKNNCNTIHIDGNTNTIHDHCKYIIINGTGSIVNKECVEINCVDNCYVGERNYFIRFMNSNYTPNDVIGRYINTLDKIDSISVRNDFPSLLRTFNKGDVDLGNYKYSLSAENNNDECVITLKINFKVYVNDIVRLLDYDIPNLYVYHPNYTDRVEFTIDDAILASDDEELAVTITMVPVNADEDLTDISDFVEYFTEAEFDEPFYFGLSSESENEYFYIKSE